jgi:antitoxin component of MazEF toxin-antitoxin module
MKNFYRSKIVAKRQMTLPQNMLDQLGLEIGDELEFIVENGRIGEVRPFRPTLLNPFTPEVERILAERESEIAAGRGGGEFKVPDAPNDELLEMGIREVEPQEATINLLDLTQQAVDLLNGMQRGQDLLNETRRKMAAVVEKGYAASSRTTR